jgi:hypothetical protein
MPDTREKRIEKRRECSSRRRVRRGRQRVSVSTLQLDPGHRGGILVGTALESPGSRRLATHGPSFIARAGSGGASELGVDDATTAVVALSDVTRGAREREIEVSKRVFKWLVGGMGGAALSTGMLLGPFAARASAQSPHTSGLTDHCVVIPLSNGEQITVCYVT